MTVSNTADTGISQLDNKKKKKKKKKPLSSAGTLSTFQDLYKLTGEKLGEGSYGQVETCKSVYDGEEYAVKIIEKKPGTFQRSKLLKEIEIYHMCRGQTNIIQLLEFFEEEDKFYLVFEKLNGGPLLEHIQRRKFFTESEGSTIVRNLAEALQFLHSRGIAHRDVKPDNVLCVSSDQTEEVKLCDFDLCSDPSYSHLEQLSTPYLSTPVGSLEYMAPEVVNTFPHQHWAGISAQAKDLIMKLLVKDSAARLTAEQVLSHPWITSQGSAMVLHTPIMLSKHRTTIKYLEDCTTKILEAGRPLTEAGDLGAVSSAIAIPPRRQTMSFNLSPINASNCDLIQRRRRKSKELFSKFLSIDELETDFFMKAIS